MGRARLTAAIGLGIVTFGSGAACSSGSKLTCGDGTVVAGDTCVSAQADAAADAQLEPTFGGVTAVAPASTTSLFVTWNDAESATTPPERMTYAVFVGSAGSPIDYTKPTATVPRGLTYFYLRGLVAKTYDVSVRAIDEAGRSDANTIVKSSAPAVDTTPPTFAGIKDARPAGAGEVAVRWDAARDDLTAPEAIVYYVYVAVPPASFDLTKPTLVTKPGATTAIVRELYDGQKFYRFLVRARDAAENVDGNQVSLNAYAGPDTTPPAFTGCKTAVADSAGSVVLTWDPATDDTTPGDKISYDIYAAKDGAAFDFATPMTSVVADVTTRVMGLASNTTWRFVCRARDFTGNRDSNVVERVAKTLVDDTPPTFGGLTEAEVDGTARTVRFAWAAASDDKTPVDQIVYDVFEGSAPGGEVFTTPRASSAPGSLGMTVTDLKPDTTLYWVVRARDLGGNHDSNTVEASGSVNVSFSRQVQPIFTTDCAVSGCHVPGNPMEGLILAEGFAYDYTVNISSTEFPSTKRVNPGDPSTSYLYEKISMNPPPYGWQMPAPATGSVLSPAEKDLIRRWILQGAARN